MPNADNSFSKDFRLLSASDFLYLKKNAKSISHKWVRFYFKPSQVNSKNSRIGIAVTKKVGKANKRNFLKRLTRDFFRNSPYKFLGSDILVLVSPRISSCSDPKAALLESLNFCFEQINNPSL